MHEHDILTKNLSQLETVANGLRGCANPNQRQEFMGALVTAITDIHESAKLIAEELHPKLIDPSLNPDEREDALYELMSHLAHIYWHCRDSDLLRLHAIDLMDAAFESDEDDSGGS